MGASACSRPTAIKATRTRLTRLVNTMRLGPQQALTSSTLAILTEANMTPHPLLAKSGPATTTHLSPAATAVPLMHKGKRCSSHMAQARLSMGTSGNTRQTQQAAQY